MASTKKTKAPQDHKPKASDAPAEVEVPRLSELRGHELLRPVTDFRRTDSGRLAARLAATGFTTGDEEQVDTEAFFDLIDFVADRFAVDADAFVNFAMGLEGDERAADEILGDALTLIVVFSGELGKARS